MDVLKRQIEETRHVTLSLHVVELSGLGFGVQCRGPFLLLSFVVLSHARRTARGTISNYLNVVLLAVVLYLLRFLVAMCVSIRLCVAMVSQ